MSYKLLLLGVFAGIILCAAPVQITISVSGGNFDRGLTTAGVDTGGPFTTSSAACSGTGCASLSNIASLNGLIVSFTVPSGSLTGSGSTVTGTLTQAQDLSGFALTGESAFNLTSSLTENISTTGVLGKAAPFTGTLALTWSGNASVQARAATGTITLNGDISAVPEPSTALLLSLPLIGLTLRKRLRRR